MPVTEFKKFLQERKQAMNLSSFQKEQLKVAEALESEVNADASCAARAVWCLRQFDAKMQEFKDGFELCEECNECWFEMRLQHFPPLQKRICDKCRRECLGNYKKIKQYISSRGADNDMDPGPVPPELQGLTIIEERLISKLVTYMSVHRLAKGAIGYSGHSIHYTQNIEPMAQAMAAGHGECTLPRKWADLGYCVVRKVGNQPAKHKDFRVRRFKALGALRWLKANNPYYADIVIDMDRVSELPNDGDAGGFLPSDVELGVMEPEARGPSETGHKLDAPAEMMSKMSAEMQAECERQDHNSTAPSSSVMNMIDTARSFVARQRAINEVSGVDDECEAVCASEDDPIAYPEHDGVPVDETKLQGFMSMAYPALFPWGRPAEVGPNAPHPYGADWLSDNRRIRMTPNEYFKHLLHYKDGRFGRHQVFRHEAYSSIMRSRTRAASKIYLKRQGLDDMTREELAERVKANDPSVVDQCEYFGSASLRGTRKWWAARRAETYSWLYFLEHTYDYMPILFHTESAADLHWPHLHELLAAQEEANGGEPANLQHYLQGQQEGVYTHTTEERKELAKRQKAVLNNPHICATYFAKHAELLDQCLFYPLYKMVENINRYEFTQRGMTHRHCMGCFQGQPTITMIEEVKALTLML